MRGCLLLVLCAAAGLPDSLSESPAAKPVRSCEQVNYLAIESATNGDWKRAQFWAAEALHDFERDELATECAGVVLSNIAVIAQGSGTLDAAEYSAIQSLEKFSKRHRPQDPVLFAPLQVLAAVYLQRADIARARHIVNRIQTIEKPGLVQLALSAGLSAALYHAEGYPEQAETEYRRALQLWSGTGSEFVTRQLEVLNNLALLYVEEGRLDEAHQVLDHARTVLDSFPHSDRLNEVILLNNLGKLLYAERNYSAAEVCLHRAVAIAEELSNLPPNTLENLCSNWAVLLRKVGRKNEAKVQQTRAASHRNTITAAGNSGVVDISQLANRRTRSAKQ